MHRPAGEHVSSPRRWKQKRHGAEAPVAFDSEVETTEPEQAHSANCFRGQQPMQLSYMRLLLQDGVSLPRRRWAVKTIPGIFCGRDSLICPS
jgi:hypothetical protein